MRLKLASKPHYPLPKELKGRNPKRVVINGLIFIDELEDGTITIDIHKTAYAPHLKPYDWRTDYHQIILKPLGKRKQNETT